MKKERAAAQARVAENAAAPQQASTPPRFQNLEQYKLLFNASVVQDVYYIPDFLTEKEEKALLFDSYKNDSNWNDLAHRRLQHFGGIPHASGMIPEPLPRWTMNIFDRLKELKCFPDEHDPNHILLNEYMPPGGKISPHKDGSLYYPSVSIVSLCVPAVFDFLETKDNAVPTQSLLVMPRSLLVFRGEAYERYYHGIRPRSHVIVSRENISVNAKSDDGCSLFVCPNDCPGGNIVLEGVVSLKEESSSSSSSSGSSSSSSSSKGETENETSSTNSTTTFANILATEENVAISCNHNKRVSFTVRSVLNIMNREVIENANSYDERERRTKVFLQGSSDD